MRWEMLSTVSYYPDARKEFLASRRTLIGSNACSGSDSQTVSRSPLQPRSRPKLRRHLLDASKIHLRRRNRNRQVFIPIGGPRAHGDSQDWLPHYAIKSCKTLPETSVRRKSLPLYR